MKKKCLVMWILFLFLPAFVCAEIGKVSASYPLDLEQPFGMTRDGEYLLISDRANGTLHRFCLKEKKIVSSMDLPCDLPWGIALGKANNKDGLWITAGKMGRVMHFDMKTKRVDFVLADVETNARGLAWDGENLWAASRDKFIELDPLDGTELRTFPGPGRDTSGITFDGTYLWLSDRLTDKIVCATRDGEIFGVLPAPGPYPVGLCRIGNTLWVLDFEVKKLFAVDITFDKQPYYLGEKHRRKVHFTHSLSNFGPSSEVTGRIYICVGADGPHQKILEAISFEPGDCQFVTDQWDQKFALLQGKIPASGILKLGFKTEIETSDLKYFILPEWIQPLDKIPPEIKKKYLVDGHKLKLDDPYIKDLVKKIVGDEKNPFWIAFKIHKYLHTNIEYKMTGGWNAAPTILKRGTGSCSEFTFSFIALARAAGLPARYEAGLVVRGDEGSIDDVYHRWAQVYLPPVGWVPVDPSRGKPATDMDIAQNFGSLSHRFFITTYSGGDSPYLGWTYNYNSFYEFSGKAIVESDAEAKWDPVIEKE